MWTKTCIYASEIFLDHIHFQYAQLLIWILTTDKFISIEKIKFSLLSISAITNELLKLIFNAYFFVENVYRICLVNILNFILKYDIWPPLIIISSLITSYWVGKNLICIILQMSMICKWFENQITKMHMDYEQCSELDHANTYEFKNYLIS